MRKLVYCCSILVKKRNVDRNTHTWKVNESFLTMPVALDTNDIQSQEQGKLGVDYSY